MKSENNKNQGFSYFFCLMIAGSESGSIPLINGSESRSGRPKNIRIRIRNTVFSVCMAIEYGMSRLRFLCCCKRWQGLLPLPP